MKFNILTTIGVFLVINVCLPYATAQESSDYLQELNFIRDPFLSQLPEPKVVPVVQAVELRNQNLSSSVQAVVQQEQAIQTKPIPAVPIPPVNRIDTGALVLKGVVWNTQMPQAIINDKVVRIGDVVSGMKIVAIRSKGVEVLNNGISTVITLTDQKKH